MTLLLTNGLVAVGGFDVGIDRVVIGLFSGLTYGLLAVGLVLVYRSSRFVNFAYGSIGAFGAAILALFVGDWGAPYWIGFPAAILVAAALSGAIEVGVVRRLAGRPSLIGMIATLGLSQFILISALLINSDGVSGFTFPQPSYLPSFTMGRMPVGPPYIAMFVLGPLVLLGLARFLRHSRHGLAIRAAADDPDAASLEGIRAPRMASLAWAIAGGIAAFSAILVTPTTSGQSIETLGPDLLLKGLAGAVIARMSSIPIAVGASLGVGVLEQVLLSNPDTRDLVPVVLGLVIVAALLRQPELGRAGQERIGWRRIGPSPLPAAYADVRAIRLTPVVLGASLALVAVSLAYVVSNETASVLTSVTGFALVGLSVGLITGVAGQLSLGQFAYAGIGGAVSVHLATRSDNFVVGVVGGVVAAGLVSALVGIPALRLKGLALAVSTLAFALATSAWVLRLDLFLGDGVSPPKPTWFGYSLELSRDYYLFALLMLALGLWVSANLWRSGFGRSLQALRDNEDAARAFTVPSRRRKLQLYFTAGALAGLGGVVIGHGQSQLTVNSFPASASIDVVALTVVGGLGLVLGPLVGSLLIVGLPSLVALGLPGQAALAVGWLAVVVLLPDGLGGLGIRARDRWYDLLATRAGIDPASARAELEDAPSPLRATARLEGLFEEPPAVGAAGAPQLVVQGLARRFGGVVAVDQVHLEVGRGEILGIIGPNGAGKTTLFEVIAGFTAADAGQVLFEGVDVTRSSPESRAMAGLVRSFQDAALFSTLTVRETVMIAGERVAPSNVLASALGTRLPDRRKAAQADELIERMGLGPFEGRTIAELSTGTRRVVELTCLLALEPRVLLLDEPSAGIAQSESEALGSLLLDIRRELGTTMIVIEHDLPLLARLCDRMVAMNLGRLVASGTPDEVRAHPAVVESYLGSSAAANDRSGPHLSSVPRTGSDTMTLTTPL
ncbi:ATP-binding cassette domain-containing protein [Nocardioides cavernae]|uniref:ATP-binding cassette domain-containing protein n=1 Tax=Nocardioides cavernae TaxID=1921566 RepID=A0ABR8NF45_9ACTN|nr:branched-chain amino acid ABC transporter permease/ATP-binding protein [Nocardioides cavernae]MBD3926748.1 ATP-binding cassette domain-containing protein [Nocardioides cavernae]MBM7512470.1 ABC-type branched-subunit amino acid transport system ATPase component/ABC-type branched-subunit amino acid transport system permease subunit [Nocardioides cavernae]